MNYPPTSRYLDDEFSRPESSARPWTPSHTDEDWQTTANSKSPYLSVHESTQQLSGSKGPPVNTIRDRLNATKFWHWLIPDSIPCRLYISVIIIQTAIDLAVEGALVLKFSQAAKLDPALSLPSARRLPVYFSIFGFAHVFQLILAIDAVWMRNTLQFFFLTAFNLIFLIYAVVQIFEIRSALVTVKSSSQLAIFNIPINVLVIIIPFVIALAELAYVVLGWSIWREFGWKVYKLLGADRRIKRLYVHYQILACIMKFDVFFWCGFSIQLIWIVLQPTNAEYYITVAALPASLIVLLAGHLGARYESRPLMYAFMLSCVGACGYFTFKLFRIVSQRESQTISPVFKGLTAFAALAITFLIATFVWSCIVLSNFGAGLKVHLSRNKVETVQPPRRGSTFHVNPSQSEDYYPHRKAKRMSLE